MYVEAVSFSHNNIDFSRYQEGDPMGFSGHVEMKKETVVWQGKQREKWLPRLVLDTIEVAMEDGLPKGEPWDDPFAEKADDDRIPF